MGANSAAGRRPATKSTAPTKTARQCRSLSWDEQLGNAQRQDRSLILGLASKFRNSEIALAIIRKMFRTLQHAGLSLIPNHYYWPVPDFKELESRDWPTEQPPIGIDLALGKQLDFLRNVVPAYEREWTPGSAAIGSAEIQTWQRIF